MTLCLVIGVGAGWMMRELRRYRDQRDAVRAIEAAGGFVWYDWQWSNGQCDPYANPPRPGWLASFLGGAHGKVVSVELAAECGDDLLAQVGRLGRLEELKLNGSAVTDAGLVHLKAMTGLRTLELWGSDVSDDGLDPLKSLTKLRSIDLRATRVTDFGAQGLRRSLPKAKIAFSSLRLD